MGIKGGGGIYVISCGIMKKKSNGSPIGFSSCWCRMFYSETMLLNFLFGLVGFKRWSFNIQRN